MDSSCFNFSLCSGVKAMTILKANSEVVLALGLIVWLKDRFITNVCPHSVSVHEQYKSAYFVLILLDFWIRLFSPHSGQSIRMIMDLLDCD